MQLEMTFISEIEKLIGSLIEEGLRGGVGGAVFEEVGKEVLVVEQFVATIEVKGGVQGALLGPLPIGPKVDAQEDVATFPGEVCKLPRYPGAFEASTASSVSEFGDDIVKDEVIVDVFC